MVNYSMTKEARLYYGEKATSSINGLGKTGQLHAKESNCIIFSRYTKINSNWIKDLNVRPKTIRPLKVNVGSMLFDISLSNIFPDMSPQTRETNAKINGWDYIRLKVFEQHRELPKKTKKQPTEWEKIFANNISDKGLTSKIYQKHIIQHQKKKPKKTNNSIKKWADGLNRHFSKEDTQMAIRYMKRCSVSLIIKEMQIKTTMRYHLSEWLLSKRQQIASVGEDVEKREPR